MSTRSPNTKLAIRIGIGVTLILASVGLFFVDMQTGRGFGVGFLVLVALSAAHLEVLGMFGPPGHSRLRSAVAWLLGLTMVASVIVDRELAGLHLPVGDLQITCGVLLLLFSLSWELPHIPAPGRINGVCHQTFAFAYVWLPGIFAIRLRYIKPAGLWLLLYVIFVSKGTDVFAYFVGRFLGKRKLIPHISPGKTVAGGVGAVFGGALISVLFCVLSPVAAWLSWREGLAYGILLSGVTIVGDLAESVIKRGTEVKDSGSLLPEFGGALDVIDCILFTAPVFALLLRWHKGVAL